MEYVAANATQGQSQPSLLSIATEDLNRLRKDMEDTVHRVHMLNERLLPTDGVAGHTVPDDQNKLGPEPVLSLTEQLSKEIQRLDQLHSRLRDEVSALEQL